MKIKLFFIFLFNLFILNVFSQSRTSVGVMASPDFTYVNGAFIKNKNTIDYTIPGFSFGLTVYKKLSKHFFINTGIWYAKRGIKNTTTVAYADTLGHVFLVVPGMNYHRYQDIEIPLLLNCKFGKSKIQYTASIGASFSFSVKETITTETDVYKITHNIPSPQFAPDRIYLSMGVGVLYKVNEKYTLLFEPNYKIDVKGIVTSIFDDTHSFGLRTTLIYKFKN
jgi:hypothetical protein